jgi:HAD superfamily hydrolase (TIGR01509 family)
MYTLAIKQYLDKHGFEALTPKAVLFDMDGVLYDSMPNHAIAWQQSMAQFGIHMTAEDAYATEGARGVDTIRMMVKQQQNRDIDEVEAQRMYDVKSHIFHELPEAPIMPGILELMQQIKDGGVMCGVVTGSGQRPLINRILKDFGAFVDENQITTAYDVKRGKPNPDPYLMGLKKAGNLKPYEAVVVENAPLGIRAGAAAKIFTIGVNTGPLTNELLLEAGANLLFPTMQDLSDCWYNRILIKL